MEKYIRIQYNLQFFAEGPGGEKTEEPTAKKLDDARKRDRLPRVRMWPVQSLFLVCSYS